MKKRVKEDAESRVAIDRETGSHEGFRRWLVVPDEAGLQEPDKQEMLSDALELVPNIEAGEFIEEHLEPIGFGRIGAQAAKQAILQKIRDAEREQARTTVGSGQRESVKVDSGVRRNIKKKKNRKNK